MFGLQLLIVILALYFGSRLGGIGLGVIGGLALAVLTFGFGLTPSEPPIDVMLMIAAVVTATAIMQTAGGMDVLVRLAERALRRNPQHITFMAPVVTYLFTLCAGTGHVAYSVMPVIAEVARQSGVRPERPMSIAVIASQQAITASPISAATVALLALLAPKGYHLPDILMVSIPATLVGCALGALVMSRYGKPLAEDEEFNRRVKEGSVLPIGVNDRSNSGAGQDPSEASSGNALQRGPILSVVLFLLGVLGVVLFGSFPSLRPSWTDAEGVLQTLGMPQIVEIVMLSAGALILLATRASAAKVVTSGIFTAGMQAVISIFGIAWMGDTFFRGNMEMIDGAIRDIVTAAPWMFAFALFVMSILLNSQAATVRGLMPLGLAVGIPAPALIAMFPSVNGYFFIPNYPTVIAAINFDRTGTTRIGRYLLNHSFMLPGIVATVSAVAIGFGISSLLL
ncbi:anaerobic C4-dicarboxylate transporter [Paenibacillus sp. ACRRX]|uniref:anaerobic C4-dicarboxylate transporter family protein n=1 Tax=unclassified Paenibacillus TaxID=185978 RepID=UPI001EF542C1|nr:MULTISPECIES: anaerobic C4-dicarboxylate transporter [unclassified Paenibacillus]MCG7408133.1 anaerobic C4-dicarboxylate transporter [Paenibacillus sp. ACRRX]MDK8181484.1 anaerobic C4-dicarboxylate transporter [Paenibacillus sp. UMB4589-SE434]